MHTTQTYIYIHSCLILDIIQGNLEPNKSKAAGEVLQLATERNEQVTMDFSFREPSWSFPVKAVLCQW